MHIEDIFEDLEAQFDAALKKFERVSCTENIHAVEIQTSHSPSRELLAPILGREFIAGLDYISGIWHLYPTFAIRKIVLRGEHGESAPRFKFVDVDLESFLSSLPTPCQIRWRLATNEAQLQTGALHSVAQNLIFIHSPNSTMPFAVPIAALAQLCFEYVDNLNGNF